jgi:hypothetical protein
MHDASREEQGSRKNEREEVSGVRLVVVYVPGEVYDVMEVTPS